MYSVEAAGVRSGTSKFEKLTVKRNDCGPDDVQLDIKYCGICHTDIHFARDEMPGMPTQYPLVPGHEIAGFATKVGKNVKDIKVGDPIGVGCYVDSCYDCVPCKTGNENGCDQFPTFTFGTPADKFGRIATDTNISQGGYSTSMTVPRRFAFTIPKGYPLKSAGPIFCSAITCYTPLKQWGAIKGGKKVGILGIGGLGQMGIKLAAAMGNEVTAISTSPRKKETALKLGAKNFVVSKDEESMKKAASSLDLIINTVAAPHQISTYLPLLAFRGKIVQLGLVSEPHLVSSPLLIASNLPRMLLASFHFHR